MRDVSSNDSEKEIEELESEDEELESVDDELESEDEELESEDDFESDEEIVTIPLQFERDGERYEIQAITLSSDRATSTIDYTGYFEIIQSFLFIIVAMNLGFAIVISFILGVKK